MKMFAFVSIELSIVATLILYDGERLRMNDIVNKLLFRHIRNSDDTFAFRSRALEFPFEARRFPSEAPCVIGDTKYVLPASFHVTSAFASLAGRRVARRPSGMNDGIIGIERSKVGIEWENFRRRV